MKNIKLAKENIASILITVLSAILNFVNLNIEGTANAYYAAAVKSMTMSFKNFFFVSFDPAGFVTIDKPLWDTGCRQFPQRYSVSADGA